MILIIGGESSGKLEFAKSLGYSDAQISDAAVDGRPVVYHLEVLAAKSPEKAEELLPALFEKEVVICNEVGSGIIPATREETLSRKAAGKLCILLAGRAETVVRMVCGIPNIIKGKI